MSKLEAAKNSTLLEMAIVGLKEHMNRAANGVIGTMAAMTLAAAFSVAPQSAHAAPQSGVNAGGLISGGAGAIAGYIVGEHLGINPSVLAATGAVVGGKIGNENYAKAQEEKKKKAEIEAKKSLPSKMEKKLMDLLVLAAESLAVVQHNVSVTDQKEIDSALSPDNTQTKASYNASVKEERMSWNKYVGRRDNLESAIRIIDGKGFNVEKYKTELAYLIEHEKPIIGAIQERRKNAQHVFTPVPR